MSIIMLKSEAVPPTKSSTQALVNTNKITINHREGDFLPKHSPSYLKADSYNGSDVDINVNNTSGGGSYRRSPTSCQSVEDESAKSSSSKVSKYKL